MFATVFSDSLPRTVPGVEYSRNVPRFFDGKTIFEVMQGRASGFCLNVPPGAQIMALAPAATEALEEVFIRDSRGEDWREGHLCSWANI